MSRRKADTPATQAPENTSRRTSGTIYFFPDLAGRSVSVRADNQEEAEAKAKEQQSQQGGATS